MKFTLPDQLPETVDELEELANQATAEIRIFQVRAEAKDEFSQDDAERFEYLLDARDQIVTKRDELAVAEKSHADKLNDLLGRAKSATAEKSDEAEAAETPGDEPATDGGDAAAAEVVAEAEAATEQAADEREAVTASTGSDRPVTFGRNVNSDVPAARPGERPKGWELLPSAPRHSELGADGRVGFAEMAESINSFRLSPHSGRQQTGTRTLGQGQTRETFATQAIGRLPRDLTVVDSSQALVEAVEAATSQINGGEHKGNPVNAESLTAAGGWCAPSEQLYDLCEVPDAVDLVSVPEIGLGKRGGIRWPNEPDVSALLTNYAFQWFFTEAQLEATTGDPPVPTAVKNFIEIPCPDEFTEMRLSAIGYAVKGGILQNQAWPELTDWFLQTFAAAHLRGVSWRTINDMVAGSGAAKVIPPTSVLGSVASVLNSLALQATNLRLNKGLSRTATIEGVAPSWFLEVLRADMALREGKDVLAVTDAEITAWLTARNIALQYVADWQSRGAGQPGNLATLVWPATVDVLLYPAGTWFRAMSPVITMGVMYPLEQLQLNQMTHMFTEDGIAVGKRCNQSILVRVPLCVSGAVGDRQTVACNTPAA